MLFWNENPSATTVVMADLQILHKACATSALRRCRELREFAEPESALRNLADLVASYDWDAEQMRKLVFIAWRVATAAPQTAHVDFLDRMGLSPAKATAPTRHLRLVK